MKHSQRTYIPGSQWIYFKIYTGKVEADKLLLEYITPTINILTKNKNIEKWFFIRYSDPDFHIRLRILASNMHSVNYIIYCFYKRLMHCQVNGIIWKVQLDTYNRELERYGQELIEEAESIFYLDSKCVLSILKILGQDQQFRWMISFKLVEALLTDFCLDLTTKQQIMGSLDNEFKKEFGFHDHNMKQLNTKYRNNRKIIETILENTINDTLFRKLYIPIKNRSKSMSFIVNKLHLKIENSHKTVDYHSLLKSYIHMMLNRLFNDKNRMHELVIYNFMNRYYKSLIAKKIYNKS
ncbi:thiopeptide-type bacteriocin biosynthesis protein [Bacteroides xylanisolvens]|uniref:thiopeptide-type bacteriocin biosynthesis protein n=1 Tax=Bacteroides xylanisolvens TaxID=371601 RepID=UPI001BA67811|nr:thiopeptide-type bacteriocin biosynthesis protein [Bacteroides xylanisolvens]